MQGQVINVEEDSLSSDTISVIIDVDITTQVVHCINACILSSIVGSFVKLSKITNQIGNYENQIS